MCSHRHPVTPHWALSGTSRALSRSCHMQKGLPCARRSKGSVWPCSLTPDSSSQTVSCLDRLISSKGDYLLPVCPFTRIVTFRYCCTPMLWFHTTPAYQQASCNVDEANTCFSLGCSYYRCCIAWGGGFPSFQLDAWRHSAVCFCVISQREWIVCGTPVIPHSEVLSTVVGTVVIIIKSGSKWALI